MSDTVTIPTWLYEKMAEVYYGMKYGVTPDRPWERTKESEPREPQQVVLPPEVRRGEVNLKDVDLVTQMVPSGYVPRGVAAKKAAKPPATEQQNEDELDGD